MAITYSQGYMRGEGDPNLDNSIKDGAEKLPKLYIDDLTNTLYAFEDSYVSGEKWFVLSAGATTYTTNIQVLLQGPADGTGMTKDICTGGFLPLAEPYKGLGYSRVGFSGETVASDAIFTANDITDWILVELRDANDPKVIKYNRAALVDINGNVFDVDGTTPLTFTNIKNERYYVAIKHRNHFGIMTAEPVSVDAILDFTDPLLAIWGNQEYEYIDGNGGRRLRMGKAQTSGINRKQGLFGAHTAVRKDTLLGLYDDYLQFDFNMDTVIDGVDLTVFLTANSFLTGYAADSPFFYAIEQIPEHGEQLIRELLQYNNLNESVLSIGTTADRIGAIGGAIRFNTEDKVLEYYDTNSWIHLP